MFSWAITFLIIGLIAGGSERDCWHGNQHRMDFICCWHCPSFDLLYYWSQTTYVIFQPYCSQIQRHDLLYEDHAFFVLTLFTKNVDDLKSRCIVSKDFLPEEKI